MSLTTRSSRKRSSEESRRRCACTPQDHRRLALWFIILGGIGGLVNFLFWLKHQSWMRDVGVWRGNIAWEKFDKTAEAITSRVGPAVAQNLKSLKKAPQNLADIPNPVKFFGGLEEELLNEAKALNAGQNPGSTKVFVAVKAALNAYQYPEWWVEADSRYKAIKDQQKENSTQAPEVEYTFTDWLMFQEGEHAFFGHELSWNLETTEDYIKNILKMEDSAQDVQDFEYLKKRAWIIAALLITSSMNVCTFIFMIVGVLMLCCKCWEKPETRGAKKTRRTSSGNAVYSGVRTTSSRGSSSSRNVASARQCSVKRSSRVIVLPEGGQVQLV